MSDEILLRQLKDGTWGKYEQFAVIECPTEEDYRFLEKAVEHYRRCGGWVPFAEQKPPEPGRYLCIWREFGDDGGIMDVLDFDGEKFPWGEVTHWMHRPEPPEGVKGVFV